jgi:hypothetical protein
MLFRAQATHPKVAMITFNLACYASATGRMVEAKGHVEYPRRTEAYSRSSLLLQAFYCQHRAHSGKDQHGVRHRRCLAVATR